jgi:AraC-like DNA-binding protein
MRKMKRIGNKVSVFWRFLFTNLLLSACSVTILALVFTLLIINTAKENDLSYEQNMVYSASTYFGKLEGYAADVIKMAENSAWLHEIYIDHVLNDNDLSIATKETVVSDLSVMVAQRSTLLSASLQFYGESTLYTSGGVFENPSHLQQINPANIQYTFFALGNAAPGFSAGKYNGNTYLVYRDCFRDVPGGRYKGEINIVYDASAINRALLSITNQDAVAFRIADASGDTLWEFRLADPSEEVVTLSRMSGSKNYSCEIDVPLSVHNRTVNRIRPIMNLAILTDLIICAGLAVALSLRNSKPLVWIVRKFAGTTVKNKNEFEVLDHIIEMILAEKSATETSLDRLRPLARQKLIGGLLDGTVFLSGAARDQLNYCNLKFEYPLFTVVAIHAPFSQQNRAFQDEKGKLPAAELAMETLLEHLKSGFAANIYLYYEDSDHYKAIVNYDTPDTLQRYLPLIATESGEYFQRTNTADALCFGVGRPVQSSSEIYRSAEQAAVAMNYSILNHAGNIAYYEEVASKVCNDYFFPFSEEMLLSRAILGGNAASAKAVLREVIETNQNRPQRNPVFLRWLYMDFCSAILRSAQSLGISVSPFVVEKKNRELMSLSRIQSSVESLIDEVCRQIGELRENHLSCAEQQILVYIEENLYNPNLSLYSIAEKFDKSPAYISTLFKNAKGVNYCDYINQTRIIRATELLTNDNMSMEEVYHTVGYISLSTFRRNFAKYTKMNPGSFSVQEHPSEETM